MFQVYEKIKATRVALIKWQWDTFKAQQLEIEKVCDQLIVDARWKLDVHGPSITLGGDGCNSIHSVEHSKN